MNLILVTALIAVCGADKLDRTYLPPASASTAGGSPGSLQTPFKSFNEGLGGLPKGSYNNDFDGVVVDAVAPGTRASGSEETGLGGPRISYGSTDSKVGDAAFTADAAFPRVGINSGLNTPGAFGTNLPQNKETQPERIQSSRDRVSNTVKYENDVSPDGFNYAFETDNGIVAEENGIEVNGVKAQGGYSYTGDDGQVYSVSYTADEDGYRPKGDHLPTPPPIPVEILKSLEKNAQDEAAGIVDDGSYDAQKYNTEEDYLKSDKGQYNGGQPIIPFGYRPQSDAEASGSFISHNNQGFIRPNSQQFGSTPTVDSTKKISSNGNNFGVASDAIKPVQNTQTFGFRVASNNEYLPPSNAFNSIRKPALIGLPTTQSNLNTNLPSSSYTSNDVSRFNKNPSTETPAFIPLGQQKLQEDRPKRPQSNTPIFGRPTVIDSTLSIKDPFAKRPSSNRFTKNKQSNQKNQSIGGSFEVVSGNVYNSNNEYLPPRRQNNKPKSNENQQFQDTSSIAQPNQQSINSQFASPNSPSVSAFASATRPSLELTSSQHYNNQKIPQYTYNKISQNPISPSLIQEQQSVSSSSPNVLNFNRSPVSQFQYRPSTFASQSPTLLPQIELTTPLESNFDRNKDAAPVPVIDGPDAPSQTSLSGLPSFGTRPLNSFQGQYSLNSNKIQQALPTQASASIVSTVSDQSITPGFQNAAEPGKPTGSLSIQSQLNKQSVNRPYSFNTQKPSFNQYNQQQSPDDSYYYNIPSKPFNSPTSRPQVTAFPSTTFDQSFKVTQTPFGGKLQSSKTPTISFTPQSNKPIDSSRHPKPSTVGTISPTQQQEQNGNTFQTQFNKVTQASTSSFPSPAFTTGSDFHKNQFSQLNTRPLQSHDRLNQESQTFNQQNLSSQPQQQFGGEIYEYKKPPQTLPTPQNGASFGQPGQTQIGSSISTPQITQSQASTTYKPPSQFGSSFSQQSLGQSPQASQGNQASSNLAQIQQTPGQVSSESLNLSQNSQPIQGASKFPPTYNRPAPACCKQVGPLTQTSLPDEEKNLQFSNQFRPNQDFSQQGSHQGTKPQDSSFAGVDESFGGPRKPPSFDKTGYHY